MPTASGNVKVEAFDVEYTDTCAKCAEQNRTGIKTGFSFKNGGVVCQMGHKIEIESAPKKAPVKPAANLKTEGAFRPGGERPEPEQGKPVPQVAQALAHVPVRVHSPVDLVNGDLEFRLVIPDRFSSAVKAEAEIQRQTPEQYLQSWIEFALENQWGR